MKKIIFSALALAIFVNISPVDVSARGFRGGGGGGGAGRSFGGGAGGMTRPAARPSVPNLSANRPAVSRPAPSRPNVSTPNINRPAMNRPATPNFPQVNRPSGGLKPSTRPSVPNLPTTRPSLPTTRPENKLPNIANRPTTRPSIPNLGGGSGNKPNLNLPNRPGNGRPNVNLPNVASRPNLPNVGGGRPSAGDLGDFLGMDRPTTLPGTNRPNIGNGIANGNRPNIGNGIGNNIGNRPNIGNGSGNNLINNRPINIGQINVGRNNIINNRPSWANIDRGRVTNINNRWQNQIGGLHNWNSIHPNRAAYWAGWGAGVHSSYRWHYHHPGCFRGDWWYNHPYRWGGWHYGYGFSRYPWRYWWTVPTYRACVSWFTWTAPQTVWAQPVYYDYGQGGNVVYNDNSVYINGDQVATTTEFAQSAAELATVAPPASEEEASKVEWLSLGTFTVSAGEKDVDPNRIVQLAVSKEGIISGTLYNTQTDKTQSIQGQVDKETQRVAFRVGESEDIVIESGLYNLTQDEAPLLVHFGPDKVENWLLVRLDDPAPDDDSTVAPAQ
ncbi:MAG: hypothetical protein KDB01_06260 [Planctomycetaceae bacterium]|nr:hypothetical protein [Planctomycetaceae bacterium]